MSETVERGNNFLSGVRLRKNHQLFRSVGGMWLGLIAFAVSLIGTELLPRQSLRGWAVLLLMVAWILAVLAWYDTYWVATFPVSNLQSRASKERSSRIMLRSAIVLVVLSHLAFFAAPHAPFGVAGWLWGSATTLVIAAALATSRRHHEPDATPPWTHWEIAVIAIIALGAVVTRVWNLRGLPFNIYPDEVMTGLVAERAYLTGRPHAPVFSTLWSDVELP
ncbi:MAG TPA: hypothetical protein VH227_00545, partial [Candidatus Udaeobacter sp.]|nr:hypothetical protein [Candidatus Udaeobacter sp.]